MPSKIKDDECMGGVGLFGGCIDDPRGFGGGNVWYTPLFKIKTGG